MTLHLRLLHSVGNAKYSENSWILQSNFSSKTLLTKCSEKNRTWKRNWRMRTTGPLLATTGPLLSAAGPLTVLMLQVQPSELRSPDVFMGCLWIQRAMNTAHSSRESFDIETFFIWIKSNSRALTVTMQNHAIDDMIINGCFACFASSTIWLKLEIWLHSL